MKKHSLYFVITTRKNISPSFGLEIINSLRRVFRDYLGVLTEESLRKNFQMVYEILDEVIVKK